MVELIVVMALVTILVGIALPRVDFERARVRSAANALVTVLSAAQSRAVLNQHDVVIRFDTVAGSALVHLDADNDGQLDSGESTRLVDIGDGVAFGGGSATPPLNGGRGVSFTQRRAGLPSLTFHRNGSASEAGTLNLVAGGDAGASLEPEHVRAIEVARPTGRAVCFRNAGSAWEASC